MPVHLTHSCVEVMMRGYAVGMLIWCVYVVGILQCCQRLICQNAGHVRSVPGIVLVQQYTRSSLIIINRSVGGCRQYDTWFTDCAVLRLRVVGDRLYFHIIIICLFFAVLDYRSNYISILRKYSCAFWILASGFISTSIICLFFAVHHCDYISIMRRSQRKRRNDGEYQYFIELFQENIEDVIRCSWALPSSYHL